MNMDVTDEIRELCAKRHAVILAHNYCRGEVQDIADFSGDSLELARRAAQVDAEVVVFAGVRFMAETAAILNPDKIVLVPDAEAGCGMADMITAADVRELKAKHPGAKAVCYVNSTAEVKAECDMCVTSGNAEKVMAQYAPDQEIIFVPDQHLGGHVSGLLGRQYTLWPGFCPIHAMITPAMIATARAAHPTAVVMVHPESSSEVRAAADERLSTGGMCAFVKQSAATEFIVGTEVGILHRLRKENPDKRFYPVSESIVCPDMKFATLEKIATSLRNMTVRITVPEDIALRARHAIDAMLQI